MRLLVLKSGSHYIRKETKGYSLCTPEKASVYPLHMLQKVLTYKKEAQDRGLVDAAVYQMTITEKKLDPGEETICD